jgi:hypothetical protein
MSNCIEIHNPSVHFSLSEINALGLQSLLSSVASYDNSEDLDLLTPDQRMAWWYLTGNTEIVHGHVCIHFGQGRSSHTWRDFQYMLKILSRFIKREKFAIFTVSDECDGYKVKFRTQVEFKTGKILE